MVLIRLAAVSLFPSVGFITYQKNLGAGGTGLGRVLKHKQERTPPPFPPFPPTSPPPPPLTPPITNYYNNNNKEQQQQQTTTNPTHLHSQNPLML